MFKKKRKNREFQSKLAATINPDLLEPAGPAKVNIVEQVKMDSVVTPVDHQIAARRIVKIEPKFKVLIPIIDQDPALYALESAMARQWPAGTQFMLMTVVEGLTNAPAEGDTEHNKILRAEQEAYMQKMQAWLLSMKDTFSVTFPNTEAVLETGQISEKICQVAASWGADYILIGSHGLGNITRIALASTASKVLEQAPCPVEAVRFRRLRGYQTTGAEVSPEKIRQWSSQAPHRIIVATDFSEQSHLAVDWIAEGCWPDNTEITLVTVIPEAKRDTSESIILRTPSYLSERKYQGIIEDRLRVLARRIIDKQEKCKLAILVLQSDSVAEAIMELAAASDADLVVVGAHGAGFVDSSKTGSNAHYIMDRAECSVIAVRECKKSNLHFSWYKELQESMT